MLDLVSGEGMRRVEDCDYTSQDALHGRKRPQCPPQSRRFRLRLAGRRAKLPSLHPQSFISTLSLTCPRGS